MAVDLVSPDEAELNCACKLFPPIYPPNMLLLLVPFAQETPRRMIASRLVAPAAAAASAAGAAYYFSQKQVAPSPLAYTRSSVFAASPAAAPGAAPPKRGVMYYVKSALAGGICCSITHGAMTVRLHCELVASELFR